MQQEKDRPEQDRPGPAARARGRIRASDFRGAEQLAARALTADDLPEREINDLRYTMAVAQRYQSRPRDALDTIQRLLKDRPDHGRAWQERGHIHRALRQARDARLSYEEALRHNPALPGAWRALVKLYGEAGLERHETAARGQLGHLEALPRELVAVTSMIHESRLGKAEQLVRHYLRQHPQDVEGMRLLARIGNELNVLTDAEFLLESALEFAPDYDQARYDLANLLLKMQKFERAHSQCQQLLDRHPENLAYRALLANAAAGIGDHHNAIELFLEVLEKNPRQNQLRVMLGHAYKTIGETEKAVTSYRAAYGLKPDYGDAYWSLANLKNYRFTEAELEAMRRGEGADGVDPDDRAHLCFALGKALEDREDWAASFHYYERGNALKAKRERHEPRHLAIRTQAQKDVCTRDFFEERRDVGCVAPDPIFIVGMPRAGSTLLEQILASHSRVTGTYELPHIIALAHRLRGTDRLVEAPGEAPRYPGVLTELDPDYFRRFGEQYLEDTRLYRHGADFFIDKNPNNFFHVGLIKTILPNARVIDARRHPLSCCFSGFKQLFGQGQEFSYGLRRIGNYYREYISLMDHWDEALPGQVLRMQYEDVVEDLETQVRRLLDFCGLDFEPACVEFHRTERSVRTPSSEQVRQPIYRSGLAPWAPFEPWLDPLKEALGPEVRRRYRIEAP
ncbi:MAG: tetratricopeptide repeat protein [Xanthomonadales bacterium]|jgi:tetratricopeptide (TPR) repeat protein|nr:tetratricopeptide repeat protein [Xanthomonadales bacterium]